MRLMHRSTGIKRAATVLTEHFGTGIKYTGPLLNTAAATHLVARTLCHGCWLPAATYAN